MQDSARNRSQKYATQAMSLVSSDDDQIDMLAARHLEQISFRISPAGLNDGGYFLLRQKCRDAFLQIALKILLNFLRLAARGSGPSYPSRRASSGGQLL